MIIRFITYIARIHAFDFISSDHFNSLFKDYRIFGCTFLYFLKLSNEIPLFNLKFVKLILLGFTKHLLALLITTKFNVSGLHSMRKNVLSRLPIIILWFGIIHVLPQFPFKQAPHIISSRHS